MPRQVSAEQQAQKGASTAAVSVAQDWEDPDERPSLRVVHTEQAPRLDGDLSEPAWSFANDTGAFVDPRSGKEASVRASAKLLWDERYLYLGIGVDDPSLLASHLKHDEPLWEQDCVGLMLDPNGDGRTYFEIQVSPRGVVFDTRYEAGGEPKPKGQLDWSSAVRAAVRVHGQLDDGASDHGYDLELAIPWHVFVTTDARTLGPPSLGTQWHANLFVLDRRANGQRAAAWSAPGPSDLQAPERFGSLRFESGPSATTARRGPVTISVGTAQRLPKDNLRAHRRLDRAAIRQFRELSGPSPVQPRRTKLESDEPRH